jgi:hypothetical protein
MCRKTGCEEENETEIEALDCVREADFTSDNQASAGKRFATVRPNQAIVCGSAMSTEHRNSQSAFANILSFQSVQWIRVQRPFEELVKT